MGESKQFPFIKKAVQFFYVLQLTSKHSSSNSAKHMQKSGEDLWCLECLYIRTDIYNII